MKKYLVMLVFIASAVKAVAQEAINPYEFYKCHEDTRIVTRTDFDNVIQDFNSSIFVSPLKKFVVRKYKSRVSLGSVMPYFKNKGIPFIHTMSLIQTFIVNRKTSSGDTLVDKNLFIAQYQGKVYGIFVYRSSETGDYLIHGIDSGIITLIPNLIKYLYLKPGFQIISLE